MLVRIRVEQVRLSGTRMTSQGNFAFGVHDRPGGWTAGGERGPEKATHGIASQKHESIASRKKCRVAGGCIRENGTLLARRQLEGAERTASREQDRTCTAAAPGAASRFGSRREVAEI